MICLCYKPQLELLSRFQFLRSNTGPALTLPPGLMPALGSLSANASNAAAALNAANSGAGTAAQQAAAAAAAAANPSMNAVAQLTAAANLQAALRAGTGINLAAPAAGRMIGDLWAMLAELLKSLAKLPLDLLAKLLPLQELADVVEHLKDMLDVDLHAPKWAEDVGHKIMETLDELEKVLAELPKQLAAGQGQGTGQAQAQAQASPVAQAQAKLVLAAEASVKNGFGVDLALPGAMDLLGAKLAATGASLSGSSCPANPLEIALMMQTLQMLSALDAIKRSLGIDLLAHGSGASLQSLLSSFASNLGGMGAASGMLGSAASAANSLGAASGASGGAAAGGSAGAGAALGAGGGASAALSAASSPLASPLLGPALANMMAGYPAAPFPLQLLALLSTQCSRQLGIDLVAHTACE